jgi:DMSO/TMAO reductase YedYZ molybdopterin-dependent catalytic subunit
VAKLDPSPPRTPPGPFRPGFWRSPLRGPWLTSALGSILLVLITIVALTGFFSHAAYMPNLTGNAIVPADRDLPLLFDWPTSPSWLYALNQGLHTNVGLIAIPFLLAKLWSVIPRLFAWPPVTSPAQGLERLAIALLVSSAVFEGIVVTRHGPR